MSTIEPQGKLPESFDDAHKKIQNYIDEALAAAHSRLASGDPMDLQSRTLVFLIESFDIHAHYYRHLIASYEMERTWYEPYLRDLSKNLLKHAEKMTMGWKSAPLGAPLNRERLFQMLKINLAARSSHWKSEGLKRAREVGEAQSNEQPVPNITNQKLTESQGDPIRDIEVVVSHRGGKKRLSSTITSKVAAAKLEAFLDASPLEKTEFARKVDVTERTLRTFRKTGKIKRKTFNLIAKEMGLDPEQLLKTD